MILTSLYERAGNTRERLADCTLYHDAAEGIDPSGDYSFSKTSEESGEGIISTSKKEPPLAGNQIRYDLMLQLAEAVLAFKKNQTDDERTKPLENFLEQFLSYPEPPLFSRIEATRRENMEMRLFAAELLLSDLGRNKDFDRVCRFYNYLVTALGDFGSSLGDLGFTNRFCTTAKTLLDSLPKKNS